MGGYYTEKAKDEEKERINKFKKIAKTNIQISTAFPEYLRKSLPKESKPVIAKKFKPKGD